MRAHLWQGDCTIGISRNLQREHLRASSLAVVAVACVGSVDSKWLKYMSQDAQGFRGFGEVTVCAGPTIWFVVHFLLICFLMVSITHRVNRASAHRAIAPHARMSVISTNIVVVMVNVFAGI